VLSSDAPSRFDDFGTCRFRSRRRARAAGIALGVELAAKRRQIRDHCPQSPGVYGMVDAQGELIYVGKSKSLRDRLLSYCASQSADSKSRRILDRTERLVWETLPDEFGALLRELELIQRWRPRFNVQGQPGRLRRTYLCLGRGPAAYAYLASEPSPRAERFFGPLPGVRRWRTIVRSVNDCFQLRDCPDRVPMVFADQLELFAQDRPAQCMRFDLGTCLGPCAGRCSSSQYAERLRQAAAFLQGDDLSMLDRLHAAMREAAALRQFERAAALRDAWDALDRLHAQLQSLRDAQEHFTFVYPLAGPHGATWYFLRRGRVIAAAGAPRDQRTARRCLQLLERVYDVEDSPETDPAEADLDVLLLVAGWFRRYPEQLAAVLPPEVARRATGPPKKTLGNLIEAEAGPYFGW